MEVHEPLSTLSKSCRIKSPRFLFTNADENELNEIVTSVTNGMSIISVHPRLYDQVYPLLLYKQGSLTRDKNSSALNYVKAAINCIETYYAQVQEEIQRHKELLNEETRPLTPEEIEARQYEQDEARKNNGMFTDSEIEESIKLVFEDKLDQIDTRIVPQLSAELRNRQRQCIDDEDYQQASIYRNASQSVRSLSTGLRFEELTASHVQELEKRVNDAHEDLYQLRQYWKKRIEDCKTQNEANISAIKTEQTKQIAEFNKHLHSPRSQHHKGRTKTNTKNQKRIETSSNQKEDIDDIPHQFCKYSSKVAELKKKEEYLAAAKRFIEAKEVRKQVQLQMEIEQKDFRKRYNDDLKVKKSDYVKKMQDKIRVKEQNADSEIIKLEREMKRQISQQQKTVKRFELKLDEADLLNQTAIQSSTSTPNSSRRSVRKSGKLTKNSYAQQLPPAEQLFRQRRAMNAVLYTRTQPARLPKIDKK